MKRIWAALALAAAAVTSLSLAVPAVASPAPAQPKAVYRAYGTPGYIMTGWRFRYLATTVTVPACTTGATTARILLSSDQDAVDITVGCGGGAGSVRYNISYWANSKGFALSPRVGDPVTISIYEDRATGQHRFTATNLRSGRTSAVVLKVYPYVYREAWVRGGGPATPATSQTRLWKFRDTRVTNYYGTRGGILSPPTTYRVFSTTSSGTVVAWPTWPSDVGHNNFDIMLGTGS